VTSTARLAEKMSAGLATDGVWPPETQAQFSGDVDFPHAGDYEVQVLVDGEHIGEAPLHLIDSTSTAFPEPAEVVGELPLP